MSFQQRYSIKKTVQAATLPVSLNETKAAISETTAVDDALIVGMILAATSGIERYLRRTLITSTYQMNLDRYPGRQMPWWDGVRQAADTELTDLTGSIEIPFAPLLTVSSITSNLEDGTTSVFAASNYIVDTISAPGRVAPKRAQAWPSVYLQSLNGVEIVYTAGYGPVGSDVPQDIRQALVIWVSDLFNTRDGELAKKEKVGESEYERFNPNDIPVRSQNLLSGYKIWKL